jgi:outer membrane lipoprotein carrier protein
MLRTTLVLASLLVASSAVAGPARERLDAFAKGLDSLNGRFEQSVTDANGNPQDESSGTVALNAPRQFRWEYAEPFPQLIVADGTNVWVWDKDLDQVTVRGQALEESQSPLTVLTDLSLIEREYTVAEQPDYDGLSWLRLTPKSDEAPFRYCDLALSGDGLARMVLTDHLGQRNEIRFLDWQRNPKLAPDLFRFTPPAGVDVVGEPVRDAESFPVRD